MIRIKKGLDLPIEGMPEQVVHPGAEIRTVALVGSDYIGLKPTMRAQVGDRVKLGEPLFSHKRVPGLNFVAPAAGTVCRINRGFKRVLLSIEIEIDPDGEEEQFESFGRAQLSGLSRAQVRDGLLASGLWTAFRTRPFNKIPDPAQIPHSIFVNAMDSNPLAADPQVVLAEAMESFQDGLTVLSHLTEGSVFVCKRPGASIAVGDARNVSVHEFDGPHPAGLVGTHIHHLDPVGAGKTVWHLSYQDVTAVGRLFIEGRLNTERIISLGGPMVSNPRLLRTRLGASTKELLAGELRSGERRIISGSVLAGHRAYGHMRFLGRYHKQISVLPEGRERELFAWIRPGPDKFSATRAFVSHIKRDRRFAMSTSTGGSPRAIVPIGVYERVMPLDILPTPLLKALVTMDTDMAQDLGCLELAEEDMALCSFVCPGKYDYAPILRENLDAIEREG